MLPPQARAAPPESVSPTTGRWVLFAAILASSMAFIDSSALNVALPALQADLRARAADLLWIVNAYALTLAALLLVGGALGDRFGRKRIFMIGIGLFAAASLACGLAPSPQALIGARAVQGVGGALMVPGSLALISASFGADQRGRAIGVWSSASTITTVLGPALGGFLASVGLWRAVFFINIPLALAALAVLALKVPESRDEAAPARLDYAGAALATVGLAGVAYGFTEVSGQGLGAPPILIALIGGALALAAFVAVEARSDHPMAPLSLFRSRAFAGTNIMTLFLYAALYGMLLFFPLNLIQVQGYGALAGFAGLPTSLMLAALSRWAGGLADRFGPRLPLTIGPLIAGAGFLLFALPGLTGGPADYWTSYFPASLTLGLGMAITVAPLTATVMGAVSSQRAGVASGINNAISRAAGVLAVAAFGAVALLAFGAALGSRTSALGLDPAARAALHAQAAQLGAARPPAGLDPLTQGAVDQAIRLAFVDMFRLLAAIAAGLAWLSALLAALMLRPPRSAPNGDS